MKTVFLAFGIGVAAGAAVALLYAPQTGTATRKQLRKGVKRAGDCLEDAGDYLRDQAEKLGDEAQALLKRTRNQMEEMVEATSGFVDGAMKTAKTVKNLM